MRSTKSSVSPWNTSTRGKGGHDGTKQKLTSGAPRDLRRKIFQEIRDLDERISGEEIELLDQKQAMKEMLKERRCTEVEEWRDTFVAGGGVTRMAAAGSRGSETEGDLFLSEVGARQKDAEDAAVAGVVSLGWQQLGLDVPKRRAISFLSEVGVLQKDAEHAVVADAVVAEGAVSLAWQQLGLEVPKRRAISFCPKWELVKKILRKISATVEKKSSNTGRVSRDTRLCLSTLADELYGAENGGGGRGRNGGAECSQRAMLELAHVR